MDSFHRDSESFLSWLQSQDGVRISPKIELADLRGNGAGRGVVAKEDINIGEVLFNIPHSTILSVHTSDLRREAPEIKRVPSWPAAIITMIYEHGKGTHSRWSPYFAVLPENFNTLLYWSDEELRELQGSAVLQKSDHKTIERFIDNEVMPFVSKRPELFGALSTDFSSGRAREVLVPLVQRMGTLIMAYAFDVENPEDHEEPDEDGFVEDEEDTSKAMVPMADMLNADGDEKNNARLEHEEEGLQMTTIRFVRKGDELFNDYGPCPNSDLLRRYGYVSNEYTPHDVVELSLDQILRTVARCLQLPIEELKARATEDCRGLRKPLTKALQRTADAEEAEFMDESYDLPSQLNPEHFFDPGLLLTIRTLVADDKEVEDLKVIREAPLEPQNTKLVELLLGILDDRLKEYPTTIAQDKKLLEHHGGPLRLRQAVHVRLGEKQVLARAMTHLREFISRPEHDDSRSTKRAKA